MSKQTITLAAIVRMIRTGSAEATADVIRPALHAAVFTLAKDGTRAPLARAAAELAECITGRGRMSVALAEAAASVGLIVKRGAAWAAAGDDRTITLPGVNVGKMAGSDAESIADSIADAFIAAMAMGMDVQPKGKKDPAKALASAVQRLNGATEAQLRKVLATQAGADLLATIARIQAGATARAAAGAVRAVRKAQEPSAAPAAAPAVVNA